MKSTSRTATAVARATTRSSEYCCSNQAPRAGEVTREAANVADTRPKADERSATSVTSETYANTTLKVTANTPEIDSMAKYHQWLIFMRGMGAQVKKTVTRRKNFLPQISLRAPIRGADKKDRSPLIPMMRPFMRKVWSGKV